MIDALAGLTQPAKAIVFDGDRQPAAARCRPGEGHRHRRGQPSRRDRQDPGEHPGPHQDGPAVALRTEVSADGRTSLGARAPPTGRPLPQRLVSDRLRRYADRDRTLSPTGAPNGAAISPDSSPRSRRHRGRPDPHRPARRVIGQEKAVEIARIAAYQHRHLLLVGPPGIGKSMTAQALALHLERPKTEIRSSTTPSTPSVRPSRSSAGRRCSGSARPRGRPRGS